MIHYDDYADVPREAIDAFVREQELGRLVTVSPDGEPHIGLYPFAYDGAAVEVHLNRADAQLADLAARSRCLFEVDEPLAIIPSYWVHPESAVMATAYHRTVVFACTATVSDDAAALVAQQTRLLARYQPEGGFRPVAADDPLYRGAVNVIAAVRLAVTGLQVKFKLGQNRPPAARARVVAELRRRGRHNDARAAAAVAWTIDRQRG
ncbi:MAG: FMN-binding negative transcriptional regulator [Candidatus Binatia bacterium]